jgi:hypothetical protein
MINIFKKRGKERNMLNNINGHKGRGDCIYSNDFTKFFSIYLGRFYRQCRICYRIDEMSQKTFHKVDQNRSNY